MAKAAKKQSLKRKFGAYKGAFTVPESFFDDLPLEELAACEGAYSRFRSRIAQRRGGSLAVSVGDLSRASSRRRPG